MKKIKNLMIVLTSILGMYSCNTIEYNYPEEKKKLLEKILQHPDSITSIVKNSIFYDEKVIEEFYKKYNKNFLIYDEPNYRIIDFIKEIRSSKFEYCLDIEYHYVWTVKEPNSKNGETYKDLEKDYIISNLFGVIFKDEKKGFGINFIKINNNYYFDNLSTCGEFDYLQYGNNCDFFKLNKINK